MHSCAQLLNALLLNAQLLNAQLLHALLLECSWPAAFDESAAWFGDSSLEPPET
jgi:hypothetical protein